MIGTEGINALKGAKILVFGVGGVGGHYYSFPAIIIHPYSIISPVSIFTFLTLIPLTSTLSFTSIIIYCLPSIYLVSTKSVRYYTKNSELMQEDFIDRTLGCGAPLSFKAQQETFQFYTIYVFKKPIIAYLPLSYILTP